MIGKGITEDQYMCCYFVLISCLIHVLENQREEIRAIYFGPASKCILDYPMLTLATSNFFALNQRSVNMSQELQQLYYVLEVRFAKLIACFSNLFPVSFFFVSCLCSFFNFWKIYDNFIATHFTLLSEFSREKFSTAVVDPMYQFSNSIMVNFAEIFDVDSLGFNVKLLATVSMHKMVKQWDFSNQQSCVASKNPKAASCISYSDGLASHITNTGFKQLKNEEKKKKIEEKKKKISALPADDTQTLDSIDPGSEVELDSDVEPKMKIL